MAGTTLFTVGDGSVHVLLSPHLEAQGLTEAAIGPVVAALSVAALATRFVAGAVYRAHRMRWLVTGGCALSATAFLLLSVSSGELLLGSLTALNGVGFALASTGGLAAIMDLAGGRSAGSVMGWYTGAIGVGHALAGFLGGLAGDLLGLAGAIAALATIPALSGVVLAVVLRRAGQGPRPGGRAGASRALAPRAGLLSGFRAAGPVVWLAFAVALHINLLNGMLFTYFPLYGLAIGMTLTQIGTLFGLQSAISSAVRFLSPLIFKLVNHRRLLPWFVGLGGLGVAALTVSPAFGVLAGAWLTIGLSRGILRVSSAALVMETAGGTGRERGAASGIYLAGLDIGRILGPLAGGVIVPAWSYEGAFLVAGLGFPLVYLGLSRAVRRREAQRGPGGPP